MRNGVYRRHMTTTPAAATAATALTAVYEAIERDTHNSHISHGGATLTGLAQLVGVLAPLAADEVGEASFREYVEGRKERTIHAGDWVTFIDDDGTPITGTAADLGNGGITLVQRS